MLSAPPPATSTEASKPADGIIHSILSYDSSIMLAAIVSLLLVILFVLLLHLYAKWFLAQARQRSNGRSVSDPQVLDARFPHFHSFTVDTNYAISPSKGLESSTISLIPLFVFKAEEQKNGLECVICLSVFENEEAGRRLPKCDHAFHVECIDMWLHSHTTCPICRAPIACDSRNSLDSSSSGNEEIQNTGSSETNSNELGVNSNEATLEIIVQIPNSEHEIAEISDSMSVSSSSSSFGSSLKRMFCRNQSERKVDLPSNVNDSDT